MHIMACNNTLGHTESARVHITELENSPSRRRSMPVRPPGAAAAPRPGVTGPWALKSQAAAPTGVTSRCRPAAAAAASD
jgi:hypothetical protein